MLINYYRVITRELFRIVLFFIMLTGELVYAQDELILVDIDWMQRHLHDEDVIVVDARSEKQYLQGHIPSAVNIPVMKTYNPVHPIDRVANLPYIRELFRRAGIRNEQTIVIYDNTEYKDAGRVFWVFEVYGHKSVKLLNGGFILWQKNKLPVSRETVNVSPSDYVPMIEPERLVTRLDMRLAIEDNTKVIIDARPHDEYIGKQSEASRFGHIPRAESIPSEANFYMLDGVQMLKSVTELKKIYSNIASDKKVYTYCNKGKDSSLSYALLRQLGYDTAHYDGSWFEWGNDATLPIEQPQKLQQIK